MVSVIFSALCLVGLVLLVNPYLGPSADEPLDHEDETHLDAPDGRQ